MPLFPAYATKDVEDLLDAGTDVWEATESREAQLLASDSEEEALRRRPAPPPPPPPPGDEDFYLDCKLDRGNLRVSTLYYPGRPQYVRREKSVSGAGVVGVAGARRERRRYWARRALDAALAAAAPDAAAAADRAAAYRRLLRDRPTDLDLWERFIDFQLICAGAEAALQAAEEAAARLPHSARLRTRLLAAARAALPRDRLLQRLRDLLADEKAWWRRAAVWERLVEAAHAAGAGAVRAAAAAALRDCPRAYPRLLHAYGVFLRMGGLWEELVLLVELVASMTFGPGPFPPPPAAQPSRAERCLLDLEDQAVESGLPLSTVWVRVERARAAAHWRPLAGGAAAAAGDPQRAPAAHELAELLLPLEERGALRLCSALLRLAKVPALPAAEAAVRAWTGRAEGADGDCAEALLPLLRAARRLPPAHPARPTPALARRLLALLLDPPHYFTDDSGYLSWVESLWEACCGWVRGEQREALVCWRLRWLHALALLADDLHELSRIRAVARSTLKQFGGGSPLAFGQFARIERVVGDAEGAAEGAEKRASSAEGKGSGEQRGGRVALMALRNALSDTSRPRHHALYLARIVCEVTAGGAGGGGAGGAALSAAGAGALVAAACRRAPPSPSPSSSGPAPPPTADELRDALRCCEEQCEELERQFDEEAERAEECDEECGEESAWWRATLCGPGEWAAARALLAPPARRAQLRAALLARAQGGRLGAAGSVAAHYWEQAACALLAADAEGRAAAAALLRRHFPHNGYLALASAGAAMWAGGAGGAGVGEGACVEERLRAARGGGGAPAAALAPPLPALLRAIAADWPPHEAEACARALRRAEARAEGAGEGAGAGALLAAARLEAEGRAPRPRLPAALYAALDRAPAAKWVAVRGAAWRGGEAGALHDLLLHRALRTHALLDELHALAPATPATPATPADTTA